MAKILIFSTAYYPFVAGAEVAIKEITDHILDMEFDLITTKMRKDLPFREKIGNVTVYRLGIGIPLIDKFIVAFEGWVFAKHLEKKKKYDAYWCMMASFASGSAYIKNIFSKEKTPIILTLQEGDSEEYLKTKWLGLINLSWKMALARTKVLTVISNYLGDRAKRLGFKGEINLIPNGVDLNKFNIEITQEERSKIRGEWGFNDGDTVLITSSRLNVKNGVGDAIEAMKNLSHNVKLVICGIGELEKSLKLKAESLELGNRIKFLGFIPNEELPKLLKASDIFIRPSLSEGQGISFIEAMAAEVPVIATPVGGIVDFLFDADSKVQTGYFCKPNDPQSIADTVKRVINDPSKHQVTENAINLVIEKYNWDKISVQMKEVFAKVS